MCEVHAWYFAHAWYFVPVWRCQDWLKRLKLHCSRWLGCFRVCGSFKENLCCTMERLKKLSRKIRQQQHGAVNQNVNVTDQSITCHFCVNMKNKTIHQNIQIGLLEDVSKIWPCGGKKKASLRLRKAVFSWRARRQEELGDSGLLLEFRLHLFWAWVVNLWLLFY